MSIGVIKDATRDAVKTTLNSKIVRKAPKVMQDVGDVTAIVGYGVTLTGGGAPLGATIAGIGNIMSNAGTGLEIGLDVYDGKYKEAGLKGVKGIVLEAGETYIKNKIKKIPYTSKVDQEVIIQPVVHY